jgi:hypothetical protein
MKRIIRYFLAMGFHCELQMTKLILIFALLCSSPAFAAIAATAQWDVRTTGSDTNGGCFDPGVTSPGTDFSQQDTAQVAFTDLVIGGTTTQLTSAANPFTSASVGNCINITAGTGFTVGRYNVRSVASGVATMDRSVGTAASTGGTGNLGGSMASPLTAMAAIVSQNTVWLKAGTYTVTAAITNTSGASGSLIGYSAAHGDNLSGTIITTATNSINLINVTGGTVNFWFHNIAMSSTASTQGEGIVSLSSSLNLAVSNCTLTGFGGYGIDGFNNGTASAYLLNTAILGTHGTGLRVNATTLIIQDSVVSGSAGFNLQMAGGTSVISRSLIVGSGRDGIVAFGIAGVLTIVDSTIANNAEAGVNLGNDIQWAAIPFSFVSQNNIIYGNGTFGIRAIIPATPSVADSYTRNNAYGSNPSGNLSGLPSGVGDVTLTANPFTNSGAGDYSLNSTAGGGALLKGTGYPGLFPNGTTTGHLDIGPVQSAGGGTTVISNYGQSY